jgi:hypothetical protein
VFVRREAGARAAESSDDLTLRANNRSSRRHKNSDSTVPPRSMGAHFLDQGSLWCYPNIPPSNFPPLQGRVAKFIPAWGQRRGGVNDGTADDRAVPPIHTPAATTGSASQSPPTRGSSADVLHDFFTRMTDNYEELPRSRRGMATAGRSGDFVRWHRRCVRGAAVALAGN